MFQPVKFPIKFYSDNQSAIDITYSNQQHARTKHFNIRLYFISDVMKNNDISVKYLPTDQMVADIFTKALPGPSIKILHKKSAYIY